MRLVTVLAAASLGGALFAGCANGPGAHELAQQACDLANPNNTPVGLAGSTRQASLAEWQELGHTLKDASGLAARAAAAETRYTDLAEDLNRMEGAFGAFVTSAERYGADPNTWPPDVVAWAQGLVDDWDEAEGAAYAQCQIVGAGD